MEEKKARWSMPALGLCKGSEIGSTVRLQHDLSCVDASDPDFHDGYTPMRARTRDAPIMQPRPRLTIVVTECDEARLRTLLEEQRHGHNLALLSCLEAELAYASVVAPHLIAPDIVTMNSCVSYEMGGNGGRSVAQLVYPSRANGASRVSVLDPLGIALLGVRAGQTVMWSLPNRQMRRLRVTDIPYQPERSGDFHL
jgi:regulator of nucleoside diphosphate kinase